MDQLFALWCEASLYLQRDIQIFRAEHIYIVMSLFEKTTQTLSLYEEIIEY